MGAEGELRRRMVGDFRALGKKLLRADLTIMGYGVVVEVASFFISLGFLWGAALMVLAGDLTIGELLLVNSLVLLASGPIGSLLGLWDEFQLSAVLLGPSAGRLRARARAGQRPLGAGAPGPRSRAA